MINDVSITLEPSLYYACTVYTNLYHFSSDISKLIKLSRERERERSEIQANPS